MNRDWGEVSEEYVKLADEFANVMWYVGQPRERLEKALVWISQLKGEDLDVIERYFIDEGIELSGNFEERGKEDEEF